MARIQITVADETGDIYSTSSFEFDPKTTHFSEAWRIAGTDDDGLDVRLGELVVDAGHWVDVKTKREG